MGRTKSKSKKSTKTEVVSKAVPAVPEPSPGELLLQSAHLIATSDYDQAKAVCSVAYEGALKIQDEKLCTDALEIMGTIELELGELNEAREVSNYRGSTGSTTIEDTSGDTRQCLSLLSLATQVNE